MFEKAGFADVEIFPQTGFWVMWTLKFNYQSSRLIRLLIWYGMNQQTREHIVRGVLKFYQSN
jgi:hypothetical protein